MGPAASKSQRAAASSKCCWPERRGECCFGPKQGGEKREPPKAPKLLLCPQPGAPCSALSSSTVKCAAPRGSAPHMSSQHRGQLRVLGPWSSAPGKIRGRCCLQLESLCLPKLPAQAQYGQSDPPLEPRLASLDVLRVEVLQPEQDVLLAETRAGLITGGPGGEPTGARARPPLPAEGHTWFYEGP